MARRLAGAAGLLAAISIFLHSAAGLAASLPLGKPGEPINLVVGFNPYFAPAWTLAIVLHKELWKKRLPQGSRVDLDIGLRGPAIARSLRNGKLHFAYFGDAAVTLAAADKPDIRLIAVTMMSQDMCVVVVRADALSFASPWPAISGDGPRERCDPGR